MIHYDTWQTTLQTGLPSPGPTKKSGKQKESIPQIAAQVREIPFENQPRSEIQVKGEYEWGIHYLLTEFSSYCSIETSVPTLLYHSHMEFLCSKYHQQMYSTTQFHL